MGKGIDTPENPVGVLADIKADGNDFIGMYYFQKSAYKTLLTKEIATAISDAGLYIVSIYENAYPTSVDYFSEPRGTSDATAAIDCAISVGQPKGTPIYFTVDCDIIPSAVIQYFKVVSSYVRSSGYTSGVYGSGTVCMALKALVLVSHTWLSGSKGWSGYWECYPHADIIQSLPTSGIWGNPYGRLNNYDTDVTPRESGGGWKIR